MARGQFTRRRIRPGYLSCRICDRDLPEEEFQVIHRRYKCSTKTYRNTYCYRCASRMSADEQKRKRQDPVYRAAANRKALATYHRKNAKERQANRVFRLQTVRSAIERLIAAGWTVPAIAKAIDAKARSVHRWRRGEGAPFRRHADALRMLVRSIDERERVAA